MVDVVAKFYVQPEKVEDFILNVRRLLPATRENDAGCIKYDLYRDKEDPSLFVFIEQWADQAAAAAHTQAKAFTEIMPKLISFTSKDYELNLLHKFE